MAARQRALGVRAGQACSAAAGSDRLVDRPIDRFIAARLRAAAHPPRLRRGPAHADPPRHLRPDRTAAHARGDRGFRRRRPPRRLRPRRRPAARLAALRRALGPALDGRRALRRHRRRQRRLSGSRAARYRDYIIDSFNPDKPYDRFVREQLAGDILARASRAAGHLRRRSSPPGSWPCRGGTRPAPFELWHLTLEDTIETTGRAFLGLTLRCARATTTSSTRSPSATITRSTASSPARRSPTPARRSSRSKGFPRMNFVPPLPRAWSPACMRARDDRLKSLEREIAELERSPDGREKRHSRQARPIRPPGGAWQGAREAAAAALPPTCRAPTPSPRASPWMPRSSAGAIPAGPGLSCPAACLGSRSGGRLRLRPSRAAASGRLELAEWLTRPDHPLTARVMVNRIWQHHFGRGIVATPSNFGIRGEPPTHPELLDWLAARFVASGWSIKDMHREILLSQTYQLSSDYDAQNARSRPRQPLALAVPPPPARRRVDPRRDAGRLGPARPPPARPHPFPPIETGTGPSTTRSRRFIRRDHRSVYLMTQRLVKHPFLAIFDGPDTNTSTDVRPRFDRPAPGPLPAEQPVRPGATAALARRLLRELRRSRRTARARLRAGLGPAAIAARDRACACRYLATLFRRNGRQRTAATQQSELEAWTSLAKVLLTANEFLYID